MADDTDSLRAYANAWLAQNHETIGPNMMLEFADEVDRLRDRAIDDAKDRERLRVDFNARSAEASRLRAVIENAPHDVSRCNKMLVTAERRDKMRCTCWKAGEQ